MGVHDPSVVRRQLGRHLRRLRQEAQKTEEDVEAAALMSRVKLWRVETGKIVTKVGDVRGLCWLYSADAGITDALSAMAFGSRLQGYWEEFNAVVPTQFSLYRDLEGQASEVRVYASESVPVLLQTQDYALAHWRASDSNATEDVLRNRAKLLAERQEDFRNRQPAPRLTVVLGAGALARLVDGTDTMAGQIERLDELSRHEQIDIRILPWAAGAHPVMHVGPFTILDFIGDDDPSVVCVETLTGARYLERPNELNAYRRAFTRIYRQSRPAEEQLRTHP